MPDGGGWGGSGVRRVWGRVFIFHFSLMALAGWCRIGGPWRGRCASTSRTGCSTLPDAGRKAGKRGACRFFPRRWLASLGQPGADRGRAGRDAPVPGARHALWQRAPAEARRRSAGPGGRSPSPAGLKKVECPLFRPVSAVPFAQASGPGHVIQVQTRHQSVTVSGEGTQHTSYQGVGSHSGGK